MSTAVAKLKYKRKLLTSRSGGNYATTTMSEDSTKFKCKAEMEKCTSVQATLV